MFICAFCGQPSLLGERMLLVPVEVRKRTYPNPNNHEKPYHGTEIVVEKPKCPGCAGTRTVAATVTQEIEAIQQGEYVLAPERAA